MSRTLPLRPEHPPDDATVVLRAGVMAAEVVRRAAERTFDAYAVYRVSLEGVIGQTVLDACRGERVAAYRQIRLSTFGRLRRAGFALLATFGAPHFTVVLPDLSEVTLARLDDCFDDRSPILLGHRRGSLVGHRRRTAMAVTPDLAVDFMDMTNDRHLITRVVDARAGYVPVVGSYAVVGDEGAAPKVARIMSIDERGIIDLEVLPGSVEAHRDLLALA